MSSIRQELIGSITKFRLEEIEPFMEEDDHKAHFRPTIFSKLAELGITGLTTSEDYSGMGLGYVDLCASLEEVAKSSVSYAVTLSVSSMVQGILEEFGSPEQKKKYLPDLASGKEIGAFCLSESGAGSDAGSLKLKAKLVGDEYVLNGSKLWITSASIANTYIVMAKTSEDKHHGISSFIVTKDMPGISFGKKEDKMGWRASPTGEVIFENCKVPKENLLCAEGEGFKIAMRALDRGRITIGAIAVGLSQRSLDEAVRYALERQQFGRPIFDFQGLQWMMADMATEIEASRLLVQKAASNFDAGIEDVKLASMAKMKATDTAMKVTTDSVQIHGAVGYTKEYPVERFMRDAKVLQIVEGTNQVQKIVIARQLKALYS